MTLTCSSTGRQLIQELRLKQEKKSFQTKEKKVETQGESAGEQARGRSARGRSQRQKQNCKTAIHTPKQVNPGGRGACIRSTLPQLGPICGGDAVETTTPSPDTPMGCTEGCHRKGGAPLEHTHSLHPSEDASIQAAEDSLWSIVLILLGGWA